MYDRVCFGFGHCFTHSLKDIVPADFHRIIAPFLNNIVSAYFMTHIVAAVKSGNIGNILLFKAPINLALFLPSFRPPVILDVYHLTPIPLQIQVTPYHPPNRPSEWWTCSKVLWIRNQEWLLDRRIIMVIDGHLAKFLM